MNTHTKLIILNFFLFSLSLTGYDYTESIKNALEAIDDFADRGKFEGSVSRVILSKQDEEKLEEIIKQDDFCDIIRDWTGGYERGIKACIAKHRYKAAWDCSNNPEKKDEIIKQAQNDARACLQTFEDYRKSFQKYNIGNTERGADMLDKIASQNFKP